jgi:hypothetical protein
MERIFFTKSLHLTVFSNPGNIVHFSSKLEENIQQAYAFGSEAIDSLSFDHLAGNAIEYRVARMGPPLPWERA